jgi:hypothetical protein
MDRVGHTDYRNCTPPSLSAPTFDRYCDDLGK